MIISRTPFRISFFGGGTDYPDWYRTHGGSVLATTIDKYGYISCRYLPPFFTHRSRIVYSRIECVEEFGEIEHPSARAVLQRLGAPQGVEIHYDGDLPARAGMGSSSAFTVGLIHALSALKGHYISSEELAREAIHVEQNIIRETVGSQDQISASYGGFNRIDFLPNGSFQVNPVILSRGQIAEMESHLMLFFTGLSRNAPDIARSEIELLDQHEKQLRTMQALVDEATNLLRRGHLLDFGRLLNETWALKRQLSPLIATTQIDEILETAKGAGAIGGKLLGAGGGGFVLLFAEPSTHEAIKFALRELLFVPFHFDSEGSKIVLYQPNGL